MRWRRRAWPDPDVANAHVSPAGRPVRIAWTGAVTLRALMARCVVALVAGACLSVPVAVAQVQVAQVTATDQYVARMDIDRDGRVALTEYQAWMGYAFERMDRNGDGQLTPDELPGGRGAAVSLSAHRETLAAAFRRQDANRDGFLSARELAAPPQ